MDTMSKAATHKVTATPAGFEVVSGSSGSKYLVVPLSTGGATCNCAYAKHHSAIASTCSHVKAVEAFAATAPVRKSGIRLAGVRGEALEAFWAGKVDAQHAVAQMRGVWRCAGGGACRCDGHIHAGEMMRIEPVKPTGRVCWLCDGAGEVETLVCNGRDYRDLGHKCSDTCFRREACVNCQGKGVEG
jgi:hypothetical protein